MIRRALTAAALLLFAGTVAGEAAATLIRAYEAQLEYWERR